MTYEDALTYAGGLLLFNLMQTISSNQFYMDACHNGMKLRVALCSLIYRKVNQIKCHPVFYDVLVNVLIFNVNRHFGYRKPHWAKQHRAK